MKRIRNKRRRPYLESCDHPSGAEIYRAAEAYRKAGLSFIPIAVDGSKRPASQMLPRVLCEKRGYEVPSWAPFISRQPSSADVQRWFKGNEQEYGLAVVAGAVSGNLEILDLDTEDLIEPFRNEVEARMPGLLDRLVHVQTPRPGLHIYYRCQKIEGSQKLARIPDPARDGKRPKTVIETKGEGGYCLAPPSPASCHPTQRCYLFTNGIGLTEVTEISPQERQVLLDAAKTFDVWSTVRPVRQRTHAVQRSSENRRPGDDFNERADWADILQPFGWVYAGTNGVADYWTRPDKAEGCSATTNYQESDLLYVFSTNADPFEQDISYSKFAAYALLNHDRDFIEAAAALKERGYGRRTLCNHNIRKSTCSRSNRRRRRR